MPVGQYDDLEFNAEFKAFREVERGWKSRCFHFFVENW